MQEQHITFAKQKQKQTNKQIIKSALSSKQTTGEQKERKQNITREFFCACVCVFRFRKIDRKSDNDRGKMSFVCVCVIFRKKEDERERDSSSQEGKTLLRFLLFLSHKRPWTQGSPEDTLPRRIPSELRTTTANRFTKQQIYTQHHG